MRYQFLVGRSQYNILSGYVSAHTASSSVFQMFKHMGKKIGLFGTFSYNYSVKSSLAVYYTENFLAFQM